ncbi:Inactive hydroxysteroid dehydrogenase-like protein 1 [Pseudocercospora fuligena]|uniref:Inactive hydroxysteroid dehydrogenase-like protein 1 n=1 Tax=Pseudocercospora fuligena TaxID=685502 RepID=A0A8H6VCZ5_9PEZI|nr:Inactive hydroxysteroid dehydrogenase-like protein 1 [Pseudocercospora fuligena]
MALISTRKVLEHLQQTYHQSPALTSLAILGGFTAFTSLLDITSFVYLHFLRTSSLRSYLDPKKPSWALVTGASDGIGRGFAEELLSQGFDVILHGRNPSKLERVKAELLPQWPNRQVEILILDAMLDCEDNGKMENAMRKVQGLNLKILVNNVAGELQPLFQSHALRSAADNRKLMNGNFIFATEMTRLLLPRLTANKPSLILNIGSGSARLPCPYIAIAAASKAFLESFSRALAAEMVAEGHSDVAVMYNLVGMCSTGSEPRPVTFLVPSSRQFARSSLNLVGSGRRTVWGYWPHALQFETIFKLPHSIIEWVCIDLVRKLRAQDESWRGRK